MRWNRLFFLLLMTAALLAADTVRVRLLVTTDLHGYLLPWDYFTARPADRGLAKVATLIKRMRAEDPHALLIDVGDTIQGSTIETVYQGYVRTGRLPKGVTPPPAGDPMMRAMNALRFDAMVVGNHEFNYGLRNLNAARDTAKFPWISSNTVLTPGSKQRAFAPYFVQTVQGVRVGIIGLTTPGVPMWDEPANYAGYRFLPGREGVEAALKQLRDREKPDVVILAAHAGLGDEGEGAKGENMVRQIAKEVPGIDAIVFGHTHGQVAQGWIGDVLIMQPKNWGFSLGVMDLELSRADAKTPWKMVDKRSRLLKTDRDVEADAEIVALAAPYHEAAEQYLNSPVAVVDEELSAEQSRVRDTALIDAIHEVQLHYAQADISFAASFNPRVRVKRGPVTVREIASLYVYDNTLWALEGNGKMVREALENGARFYQTCPTPACDSGPLINPKIIGFNYDMAAGVTYEVDLRKPEGQRIQNLRFRGEPLQDDQPLRIAVNNYRGGGSGGYTMFRGAKVLWQSTQDVRDLMIEYFSQKGKLPSRPDGNWRVVPEAAVETLRKETAADARRGEAK
jgi:2',3'-cyclic-nucleotide 2'-phosphodiesterase/3'-nucleotidase